MDEALRTALARNLKAARLALGLTQADLAKASGVPRTDISDIENATSDVNPTAARLARLAKPLKTSASRLLSTEE